MKTKLHYSLRTSRLALSLGLLAALHPQPSTLLAQGTVITCQGRLSDNNAPANGIYDLRFTIYDLAAGGNSVAGPLANSATAVSGGLFVVGLDFGALNPRQALTATPYAIRARSADVAGTAQLANALPAAVVGGDQPHSIARPAVARGHSHRRRRRPSLPP
jgi:hypothetical protein